MKLFDLYKEKRPVFSLEVFPPKKPATLESMHEIIERLQGCQPDFMSVTYGAGGNRADNATCEIAVTMKERFGIEGVAHLTCINSSRAEVTDMIRQFEDRGIENVLALRGDIMPEGSTHQDFSHASELAIEIRRNSDLQILGACYPEGHCESKNLREDVQNLKYKIGAGVRVLVTQLFFNNKCFYDFMAQLRNAGITAPVSAGIMPIVNKNQIEKVVALSGASLPYAFTRMISRYENDPEELFEQGIRYASDQIRELIEHGVDGIHLYTMNNAEVALRVYDNIRELLPGR